MESQAKIRAVEPQISCRGGLQQAKNPCENTEKGQPVVSGPLLRLLLIHKSSSGVYKMSDSGAFGLPDGSAPQNQRTKEDNTMKSCEGQGGTCR